MEGKTLDVCTCCGSLTEEPLLLYDSPVCPWCAQNVFLPRHVIAHVLRAWKGLDPDDEEDSPRSPEWRRVAGEKFEEAIDEMAFFMEDSEQMLKDLCQEEG